MAEIPESGPAFCVEPKFKKPKFLHLARGVTDKAYKGQEPWLGKLWTPSWSRVLQHGEDYSHLGLWITWPRINSVFTEVLHHVYSIYRNNTTRFQLRKLDTQFIYPSNFNPTLKSVRLKAPVINLIYGEIDWPLFKDWYTFVPWQAITRKRELAESSDSYNDDEFDELYRNVKRAQSIDRVARVVFPVVFLIFIIVYWSMYASQSYVSVNGDLVRI